MRASVCARRGPRALHLHTTNIKRHRLVTERFYTTPRGAGTYATARGAAGVRGAAASIVYKMYTIIFYN